MYIATLDIPFAYRKLLENILNNPLTNAISYQDFKRHVIYFRFSEEDVINILEDLERYGLIEKINIKGNKIILKQ